jgi:hypothetical protein
MNDARRPMKAIQFEAEVIHWRGPAPFFFAPLPKYAAHEIAPPSTLLPTPRGMIPVDF